jgi:excisionase family DNA binding protein
MENLMTTKELCDYLKLSRMTIERYRKAGLPYITIGKNIRFEKDKVLEWLKNNERKDD